MPYAYQDIAQDLLRRIRSGEWSNGRQMPTLRVLEEQYPQSRMTLYKALQHLEELGHITMARRRGTFVKAATLRDRIAILTRSDMFQHGCMPFAFQAFQRAQSFFARAGLDSQLYVEDGMAEAGLPSGLIREFEQHKLAGLMAIDARFPAGFMRTEAWARIAVPVVNIGAYRSPHMVYVDREAFIGRAVALAVARGHRRVALVERIEHLADHGAWFRAACERHGAIGCPYPEHMPSPELTYEEYGFDLVQRLWKAACRPDALVVPDDVIAKGVAQAAAVLGIAVPRELTIMAMTNRGAPFFYPVPVVRFEVDVEAIVMRAARMLMDMISGTPVPPQTVLVAPMEPGPPEPDVARHAPTGQEPHRTSGCPAP